MPLHSCCTPFRSAQNHCPPDNVDPAGDYITHIMKNKRRHLEIPGTLKDRKIENGRTKVCSHTLRSTALAAQLLFRARAGFFSASCASRRRLFVSQDAISCETKKRASLRVKYYTSMISLALALTGSIPKPLSRFPDYTPSAILLAILQWTKYRPAVPVITVTRSYRNLT